MGGGARWATVHSVAKSQTQVKQLSMNNALNIRSLSVEQTENIEHHISWGLVQMF